MFFWLFVLGLSVGVVSSLLGIGGGVFLVPFLPAITNWNNHQVVAFSLLIIFGNSLLNLIWFHRQGLVNWHILKFWGPMAAIGSFIGSYLAVGFSGKALRVALLTVIVLMILRFTVGFYQRSENKKLFVTSDWHPLKSVYAILVGTLSGFCGVGTGLVSNMFFMSKKWVLKDKLSPTGNGVMLFVSFASLCSFLMYGAGKNIDFDFLISSKWQALALVFSVFVSSFLFRPLNAFISDGLRFMGLFISLVFVFGYVLYTL